MQLFLQMCWRSPPRSSPPTPLCSRPPLSTQREHRSKPYQRGNNRRDEKVRYHRERDSEALSLTATSGGGSSSNRASNSSRDRRRCSTCDCCCAGAPTDGLNVHTLASSFCSRKHSVLNQFHSFARESHTRRHQRVHAARSTQHERPHRRGRCC